jgi:hypothetical protein
MRAPKIYRLGPFRICRARCSKLIRPGFWIRRFRDVVYVHVWRTQYSVRYQKRGVPGVEPVATHRSKPMASSTSTILPPPPDHTVVAAPVVHELLRPTRCPSCGEIHYRPTTIRETPLPKAPRTDTRPVPRKRKS